MQKVKRNRLALVNFKYYWTTMEIVGRITAYLTMFSSRILARFVKSNENPIVWINILQILPPVGEYVAWLMVSTATVHVFYTYDEHLLLCCYDFSWFCCSPET